MLERIRVIINGKKIAHCNSVKGSVETSTETTPCFDGVVTQGSSSVGYSLSVDRLNYEGLASYREVAEILTTMLTEPGVITVEEDIFPAGEPPLTHTRFYSGCILDSKEYEMDPEKHTVSSLKWICSGIEETYEEKA